MAATLHTLRRKGLIVFSGADAQAFLQGQLSCDVAAVAGGKSSYGSYCTPQGRILASFLLWRAGDEYFMQLPAVLCEPMQKRLSMYVLRAKAKATLASDAYAQFGIAGDDATRVIAALFADAPAASHEVMRADGATVIRLPGDRFLVIAPTVAAAHVRDALVKSGASEADEAAWERLDIRAGVPWITPATQEQFIPQMVNLDLIGGVSFSKGCYPGQEIVARAHYRGQVKQRMHLVHIDADTAVQPGDSIYSAYMGSQSSGAIVNAAPAPRGGYDALAVIQTGSVESGDVHWRALDGPRLEFLPRDASVTRD
ncbi:MAG TPA: folate-binding protein [Burkholderiales bacterium]|nr:folate-binding protein [Burkholderiales bacterium]